MAARNRSTANQTDSVSSETEDTAVAVSPETATPEADLTAITALAETAIANSDEHGAPADTTPVVEAYRSLDPKAKRAFRELIKEQAKSALMVKRDADLARGWMTLEQVVGSATGKTVSAPVDPTEASIQRGVTFGLAYRLVMGTLPEGADAEAVTAAVREQVSAIDLDQVNIYTTWLDSTDEAKGAEPEVSAAIKAAVSLSRGKAAKVKVSRSGGTSTGERKNTLTHLEQVFADKASGTFMKVSEIANAKSAEYGDESPSAGAITARLFPNNGKPVLPAGITAVEKTATSPRGAVKA